MLIWILVGQGPTALTVGAGGVVWTFFLSSIISPFFLPLSGRRPDIDRNTVSKGLLTQKNQPNIYNFDTVRDNFTKLGTI